jgi:hypothetical protein
MSRKCLDIGVNWVQWLRDLAARYYVRDERAGYYRVSGLNPRSPYGVSPDICQAWDRLPRIQQDNDSLRHNVFVRDLETLAPDAQARINTFFAASGLRDFEFLGAGGRALAYRALHAPTGQFRIARMEGAHSSRMPRPAHPVVLQTYQTNQNRMDAHGGIKLEILPEIVPLNKAFLKCALPETPLLKEAFYSAAVDLGWGTNLMYGPQMYDRDAEFHNIGIRPDGRLVSFDPEIITGPRAALRQHNAKTPKLLSDASAQQLLLIYPGYR